MKKRLITLIIALIAVLSLCCTAFAAEEIPLKLYGDAALVMNLNDGMLLYEKNAAEKRFPASTTKMMTCIIALERLDLNSTITIDADSAALGGNSLKLKTGEKMNARDLLYATMVISANDGASAIAKAVAGNIEEFAKMMNKKAQEIGCTDTNFVNPHGLHDDEHYTTALDLARIAYYAMNDPKIGAQFREIVSNESYTVPATNLSQERVVENTNWLLYDTVDSHRVYVGNDYRYCKYDGCIGIKTGQTSKAGCCIVAAATKGDTSILVVTLHSKNIYERFSDAIALLDLGFDNYKTSKVLTAGSSMGSLDVKRGSVKTVPLELAQDVSITLSKDESMKSVSSQAAISVDKMTAPIEAGTVVGTYSLYKNGFLVSTTDIITAESVSKGGILSVFGVDDAQAAKIWRAVRIVLIVLLVLVVAFAAWVIYEKEKVKRKKARKAARLRAKQEKEAEARRRLDYESFNQSDDNKE